MPFNGSGTFVPLSPPDFPALPFTTILASQFNNNLNDLFTSGLTNCITRDGQSPPTANLPMAGFRLTGLGPATTDTDAVQMGQTLATRGQVGVVDWNTRITNGIFEAIASNLTSPATNFPPVTDLGMLYVTAQGALILQYYVTGYETWNRQKLGGVWSVWVNTNVRKNYQLNPSFQIFQEAGSLPSGAGKRYLAEMWNTQSNGTTNTAQGIPFPLSQTDVDPSTLTYFSTTVTSVAGANNFCWLEGVMEYVRTLAGKLITVSFWAKANTGRDIAVELGQVFGTGGSPSAAVSSFVGKVTVTTAWARYNVTGTVPTMAGKTLGSNNDDYFALRLWFDAGSGFNARTGSMGQQSGTFDISNVKICEGPIATNFEVPEVTQQLLACSRYFTYGTNNGTVSPLYWTGNAVNAVTQGSFYTFKVNMRAVPTITQTNLVNVNFSATTFDFGPTVQGFGFGRVATATGPGSFASNFTANARF